MPTGKSVLFVGFDPKLIDFSRAPDPTLTAAKVTAALEVDRERLAGLGHSVQICLIDLGDTAEAAVNAALDRTRFDCVMIGAGVRLAPASTILFEKLVNLVRQRAPQAKICFNTNPGDSAAAVLRWV